MTDRAAVIEKIAAAMRESGIADLADLSGRAEVEAKLAIERQKNHDLADALETITDSYRALSAVADLMLLGGSVPGQYRPALDCVAADDMFALLRILALSLAKPLKENGYIS